MKNKLIRLAELIQEGFPGNLVGSLKSRGDASLSERLALVCEAITFHQRRSEALWTGAGRKRTAEERRATAQAELAAFVFAYLTGDAGEYEESAIEAMRSLGRQGEEDLVRSLAGRRVK